VKEFKILADKIIEDLDLIIKEPKDLDINMKILKTLNFNAK